jgi:hypothetical protein
MPLARKKPRPTYRRARIEPLESRLVLDSTVVFNELMYNPSGDGTPEWIELHNQMAVNIDISRWRLQNGVEYTFPANTVVPGGGYVVIAADPSALQAATGFSNAFGPFTGQLANQGEQIDLVNHANRVMDTINFSDDSPWPVGPDGSGATLAKVNPQHGSDTAESWITSPQIGGTPGSANIPPPVTTTETTILPFSATYRYNSSGANLGTAWTASGYNDTASPWLSGPAPIGVETAALPVPLATTINPYVMAVRTHYFRTTFNFDGNLNGAELRLRHMIDDGAVFYLNGQEVSRAGMPTGTITSTTLATAGIGDAGLSGYIPLPTNLLVPGPNTFAVEVHQNGDGSSDVVFGAELVLQKTIVNPAIGTPAIGLNEVAGANDGTFRVELRNNSATAENLAGYVLATTGLDAAEYVIPAQNLAPGGLASFDLASQGLFPAEGERLFLYSPLKDRVVDAVVVKSRARGRSPDGAGPWRYTSADTFNAANAFSFHDEIVINEIMYHATPTYSKDATYSSTNLVSYTSPWRYQYGTDLGTDWRARDYDDTAGGWQSGNGLFYVESAAMPATKTTPLAIGSPTFYFRTEFQLAGDPASAVLQLRHIVDDAAVFYLNGVELNRFNFTPATNVVFSTNASVAVGDATIVGPIDIPTNLLLPGKNVLAVEVHQIVPASNDVVFGAEITGLTLVAPATEFEESDEEWLELYNRSDHTVDLTGWDFENGIDYQFPDGMTLGAGEYLVVAKDPAAFAVKYPGINVVGPYGGELNNRDDRIVLDDENENPADEVRYYEGGSWAEAADGGGRSLELTNPFADNASGGAWAASDESDRSGWRRYTYTAVAIKPVYDPVTVNGMTSDFRELRIGLLDSGEALLDNISVIENPGGTNVQLVQNGSFTNDAIGGGASKWRFLGTHSTTRVVNDPDSAGNKVLHLSAQSKADYLDNLLETTTVGNAPIVVGRTYEISFDAKWLSGSPQLRAELYYNRVVALHILDHPDKAGTPGARNSTYVANAGPTYSSLKHGPVTPGVSQPATVSLAATDNNGIAAMTLWYSANGGAWASTAMTLGANGLYSGNIPGQQAGIAVQFYVEGRDSLGATSTYPAAGRDSRAMIEWQDGRAQVGVRHNFRMIMTQADINKLFTATNMMSNERLGATVVYDESEVFYDVGIRLRGSMFSRQNPASSGYNIKFNPEQLFRGVHSSVTMKTPGKAEILVKHSAVQLGIPQMYDDLIYMNTPAANGDGIALMSMARYGDEFITTQYDDGGDGTVFKMQGVRVLYNNTGDPEALKTYQPVGWIPSYDLANLGDKEQYRWSIQIMNNRAKDDYGPIVDAMSALSLDGVQLEQTAPLYLDVDQWMRTFALQSLWGIGDAYMQGNPHNIDFYIRPSDNKVEVWPWDWNFVANYAATSALYGIENRNVTELIDRPVNRRLYYGHMRDMILTSFNPTYLNAWTTHYGTMAGEGYGNYATYVSQRGTHVLQQLNSVAPNVPFNITTPNGQQHNAAVATISGDGWIDVREIRLDGEPVPLEVTWTDFDSWTATVPIAPGTQTLRLRAFDHQGTQVGTDTVTITSTLSTRPIADHLRISEVMYHPGDPTAAELAAGFGDGDDFEFIELVNTSTSATLDLEGVIVGGGVDYIFGDVSLAPGARIVVVGSIEGFAERYGDEIAVAGQYSGRLNNAGERLVVVDSDGLTILDFTYDDTGTGWHPSTDGPGYSLTIINEGLFTSTWNNPAAWRPSFETGGSPGSLDTLRGDINGDLQVDLADLAILQSHFGIANGATPEMGDINGDGAITRVDAAMLSQSFGKSVVAGSSASPGQASASIVESTTRKRIAVAAVRRPRPQDVDATFTGSDLLVGSEIQVRRLRLESDSGHRVLRR